MLQITRRPLTLATIVLPFFVALLAVGQPLNEFAKLVASAGAVGHFFGSMITINGGIVTVGR